MKTRQKTLTLKPHDLLTTKDVVELFDVTRSSVVSAIDKGRIPAARIGRGKGVFVVRKVDAAKLWLPRK